MWRSLFVWVWAWGRGVAMVVFVVACFALFFRGCRVSGGLDFIAVWVCRFGFVVVGW